MQKVGIDIYESWILKEYPLAFAQLLSDKTTGKNIIWATKDYELLNEKSGTLDLGGYNEKDEMMPLAVIGSQSKNRVIRPRCAKEKDEQQSRTKQKAEVFTPLWVCRKQNDLIDEAYFGRKTTFFKKRSDAGEHGYRPVEEVKAPCGNENPLWWQDYILKNRMEITCGEAPYLVSRYDSVSGKFIKNLKMRIGLLDRKMRIVDEFCKNEKTWLHWALVAFQSTYGFEWQGDNLLIARENLLFTFYDHYQEKFGENPTDNLMAQFAEVVAWNIFQMDGLKFVIPLSCHEIAEENDDKNPEFESIVADGKPKRILPLKRNCPGCEKNNPNLHNGIYVKIKDWTNGKVETFKNFILKNNE